MASVIIATEPVMTSPEYGVLLVDPDTRARSLLSYHLQPLGFPILECTDGAGAMAMLGAGQVRLVLTELYLATGSDDCLVHAIRREKANRHIRIVAHTHRALTADREWAMRAGADAYLIKPTRPNRVRYVVARLATVRAASAAVPVTASSPITRRGSLDAALSELEHGSRGTTSCIVFGRSWWETLLPAQRLQFRQRAKRARVNLRSDSLLGDHFVEVRGRSRDEVGLSTERPESPYRR